MEDTQDAIAVVGIGCHFPGGEGLESFWDVLVNGKNCCGSIPNERFIMANWYDPDETKAGKSCTAKACLIETFNEFDHKFFGISDSEVEQMDPQQKLLLQCVYRALENAGIPLEKASGTRTGVFIGMMNRDYETNAAHVNPAVINHWTGTGLAMSIAANRVSYIFNFTGPSLSVDSACSSSLVALHLACQSIKQDDCEMALCGGVNCIIEPRVFVALSKAKMISPDGTSKPFSSKASGYGRGEGCGVVLLKPLGKALQDRDRIWGLITKTAVNQDGHSVSPLTRPSVAKQEALLRKIYTEREITNVQYIEAHGTGTPVGDQTEVESISNVICRARPPGSKVLWVGSVKSNIGHTESAAGVAGLIKVLLMMKHEAIVPSVFYSEKLSSVDAKSLRIKIPEKTEKWECSDARMAGVNNFGFGGTNAHAIVTQYMKPQDEQRSTKMQPKHFVISAVSLKSLSMTIQETLKRLKEDEQLDLDSLLYTCACRRSHQKHKYRKAILVSSKEDLKSKLRAIAGYNLSPTLANPRLVFVFCGNGLTYPGMCNHLLKKEPVFREKVQLISDLFRKLGTLNILDTLESEFGNGDSESPHIVQPLLFAIQVAISTLLERHGVRADAMLGHSVGEVAAAHCSGLLSLEDAVKVIYHRSILQSEVTGGKMLVISNMAVSEVMPLLSPYSGTVCLAAFNSPQSCTVSGNEAAIKQLHAELSNSENSQSLFLRILDVPAAYHSHMMDPILPEIEESIGNLSENDLVTKLFSTVTGEEVQKGDFASGKYWARNIREPVAFERTVRAVSEDMKSTIFVEIGPRRALQRNIMETLGNSAIVLASVEPQKDHESLSSVVCQLFELGCQVNWDTCYKGCETVPVDFPRYHFDCSNRDVIIAAAQNNKTSSHPVLHQIGSDCNVFSCDLKSESTSYLKDHKHNNISIIPGAFFVELGLAAFLATAKPKVPLCSLQLSVNFHSPFVLSPNSPEMKIKLEKGMNEGRFTIYSTLAQYASGTITSKKNWDGDVQQISLKSIYTRCTSVVSFEDFYGYMSQGGFQYGGILQNKVDIHYGKDLREAFAFVSVPSEELAHLHDYCIHPVVLDYLMQILPVTVEHTFVGRPGFPAQIGSIRIIEPLKDKMVMYLRATIVGIDHFEVCGCLTDMNGKVLVEVKHVVVKYIGSHFHEVEEYFYHNTLSVVMERVSHAHPPKALVFSDSLGIAKGLQQHLDKNSQYISLSHAKDFLECGFTCLPANLKITDVKKISDVLFLWGTQDLTSSGPDDVLQILSSSCEMLRQIVVELKRIRFPNSIRVITYRSSDITVDRLSPGFALAGMTRSCAAEIPDLSFQLVDLNSLSSVDIAALMEVMKSFPCSTYPELVVKDGQVFKPVIVHTPTVPDESKSHFIASSPEFFVFQTADAYKMTLISAVHSWQDKDSVDVSCVEIQPHKICAHSSDYFPTSLSDLTFGQTIYWNNHSSQNHKLLALDFSGTVTAVGKNVKKLKVGDHVASCYPVVAVSRINVPEDVCYSTKKFPFFEKTPCVSFFLLAWQILHKVLPTTKQTLGIVCSAAESSLVKVLALACRKSGWNVIVGTQCNGYFADARQVQVFLVLPPFDESLLLKLCSFPGVQHVVVTCETQNQGLLVQDVLRSATEDIDLLTIVVRDILKRGCLRTHRSHVYQWLKSLNLSRKFEVENFVFQSAKSEGTASLSDDPPSYFSSKRLAVVIVDAHGRWTPSTTLEKDADGVKSDIPLLQAKEMFSKKAVYVVSGGLSGLGLETVKFISQRGGGHIIILSRSKPTPEVQYDIRKVERQCGNRIISLQCDVSVSEQVHNTIKAIEQLTPGCPIRGVFHSAVVLDDGLIETLCISAYEKVFKPKINGVLNLHHATRRCELDYFVCFSSISAFLGNASQTNYAAANSFLDLFCHYRRKLGLAAQSINWGALNLGLLLNKEYFQRFLESKGMMVLEVAEVHKSLEQCLTLNQPQQAVCRFHFKNIRYNILSQNKALTLRLSALVEEAFQKSQEIERDTQTVLISPTEYVFSLLCETIGLNPSEIKEESPLLSLGIDSMQAMTLQNLIFQGRGVNLPLIKLLDPASTVSTLIAYLTNAEGKVTSDLFPIEDTADTFTIL